LTAIVAANHTSSDAGNLTTVCPPNSTDHSSIIVGNGIALLVTSVGDTALLRLFYLNNNLVAPDITQNLLSLHHFTTDNWCSMEFDSSGIFVNGLSTLNVIIRCNSLGPLYMMYLPSHPIVAAPMALVEFASTWHCRLGHPAINVLSKLSNNSSGICSKCTHDFCHTCKLSHHTRMHFVSS
jgi:hypothetical protein